MYKKVELNDNEVLQNGIIIGQVIKKIDEGFVVRLNGKIALRLAFYGTVDRKGNFYQFCRNNNCGLIANFRKNLHAEITKNIPKEKDFILIFSDFTLATFSIC